MALGSAPIPNLATLRNRWWLGAIVSMSIACKDNTPSPTPVSPPDLELVSAGSEPRQVLRYKAPAGTLQKVEVSIAAELTAGEMGGPMPTLVLRMSYAVDAVMPTGQMTLRATIDNVTAMDAPQSKVSAASLRGPLASLNGLVIHSVLAPNGRVTGSTIDRGSKTFTPDMEQQLNSLVASFESTMMTLPDEPVGAGAVWRNSRPVEQNGLKLKAVNSITLSAIRGDTIDYSIDTAIHGADQSIKQSDITIEVKDLVGNGGGKGTVDLAKLAVTSELAAEFRSEMRTDGDPAPTKMEMATLMRVRPL